MALKKRLNGREKMGAGGMGFYNLLNAGDCKANVAKSTSSL